MRTASTSPSRTSHSQTLSPSHTMSDLDIASSANLRPLTEIASAAHIPAEHIELYGASAAKVSLDAIDAMSGRPRAKYVVVSAITPTPLGEGKTTTTVGLGQAFQHLGRTATIAIRQPSMGPTFGIKGGAAGGGYSQVVPMDILNLHLTGDMHAVTAAHNMCAAVLDAHLHHGNKLNIDIHNITWRRVLDVNDRALRNITLGLGGRFDGVPRQSGFDITAASEVMAALALCSGLQDLRTRLGRIVVGYTKQNTPVTAEELKVAGAMAVILREAVKPNLMQTLENTPVLVHTGPFGNIATGNSSVVADQIGIRSSDFLLTEAGFGADMGAERFFNIKCRYSKLVPDAAVIVATVRGLKAHSGKYQITAGRALPDELFRENPDDVYAGGANLRKQIENIKIHGCTPVVAINAFSEDHRTELNAIADIAAELNVASAVTTHYVDGGKGAAELAEAIIQASERTASTVSGTSPISGTQTTLNASTEVEQSHPSKFTMLYPDDMPLKSKIETIARKIYGANGVEYSPAANRQLQIYKDAGFGHLPVCVAKTHLSISSDPKAKGAPEGWVLPVREVRASVGAGFIYPICGHISTMPGLGSTPAAHEIDIDADGEIIGLS